MAVIRLRPFSSGTPQASRRGVASVLAMMFLVIFSSLAAAMAVVAQGNLRTADSGMKLSRAMSAAETGLTFATRRLASESSRFVVSKGVVDSTFATKLWLGTYSGTSDGTVTVRPPTGYTVSTPPLGIIYAVRDAHLADSHSDIIDTGDSSLPAINTQYGTLSVRPIRLSSNENAPYFRLSYELVSGQPAVRVTSRGVDGDVQRTLQMDFTLTKKIEFAVISPNRIMIGKNVRVEGPLGSRYGIGSNELSSANGDPLVMRSDFYYLNTTLNTKLSTLFTQVAIYDNDGDSRLRPEDPSEAAGLSGQPDLVDYNGDEYVDDYDLFLKHYDANGDHKVIYRASAGAVEFSVDIQMARLIDLALPDRDGDGLENTSSDQGLGYNDGVLDVNDQYAKVHGRLAFAVARSPWDLANGTSYQFVVNGAVRVSEPEDSPVKFEVTEDEMREITTAMFDGSQTWFQTQSSAGAAFASQAGAPSSTNWEATPFGADENSGADFGTRGAYDYYNRPKYVNKTFTNVKIPKGTNALFENCTFKGVTYIQTETNTADPNWNYTGAVEKKVVAGSSPPTYTYPVRFPSYGSTLGGTPIPSNSSGGTKLHSNNIRFHNCTFLGSMSGDRPSEYTHWRNKLQMTGTTRFYIDVNDSDLLAQPDANSTTHPSGNPTGPSLVDELNSMPAADIEEMKKSSILMPGWSIDVGSYTNEQASDPTLTPKIKLKGAIVAGIMDIRGTADVFGTLLMTYRPVTGQGPLTLGGLLDGFNTTIGYFYPSDGDGEGADPGDVGDPTISGYGEISLRYDPDAKLPDGIPWPVTMLANPATYSE